MMQWKCEKVIHERNLRKHVGQIVYLNNLQVRRDRTGVKFLRSALPCEVQSCSFVFLWQLLLLCYYMFSYSMDGENLHYKEIANSKPFTKFGGCVCMT